MTLTQNFFIDILNIVKGDNFYCEFRKKQKKFLRVGGALSAQPNPDSYYNILSSKNEIWY